MSSAPTTSAAAPSAAAAPTTVARIAKITVSDYRAFPSGQVYEFDLGREGKNLLLYGENGSGKTSLFRALRDLTSQSPGIMTYADYRNLFSPGTEGAVSAEYTAGAPAEFRWDYGEPHPARSGEAPFTQFPGVAKRPRMMYNSRGNPIFMLCFAMGNPAATARNLALKIAQQVLSKV